MDQKSKLPDTLLDNEGYPTQEWIDFIKRYVPGDSMPIESFVENVLVDGWWMSEWGFVFKRRYGGKRKLELHTGGWSGNEEVIQAIFKNTHLTILSMRHVMWRTGGHYYFEVPIK